LNDENIIRQLTSEALAKLPTMTPKDAKATRTMIANMIKADVKELMSMRNQEIKEADNARIRDVKAEAVRLDEAKKIALSRWGLSPRNRSYIEFRYMQELHKYRVDRYRTYITDRIRIAGFYESRKYRLIDEVYMIARFPWGWFPANVNALINETPDI
jgi:hypothetical protein